MALAKEGQAPMANYLLKKPWWKVPVPCVLVSALLGLLAFMSIHSSSGPTNVRFQVTFNGWHSGVWFPWWTDCDLHGFSLGSHLRNVFEISMGSKGAKERIWSPAWIKITFTALLSRLRLCNVRTIEFFISIWSLTLVIFIGYGVFTRHQAIWSTLPDDWGISIGPWVTLAAFAIILLGWLVKHKWSFEQKSLQFVDLDEGAVFERDSDSNRGNGVPNSAASPVNTPPSIATVVEKIGKQGKKAFLWFLNKLWKFIFLGRKLDLIKFGNKNWDQIMEYSAEIKRDTGECASAWQRNLHSHSAQNSGP